MAFNIRDKATRMRLRRHFEQSRSQNADALAKLSSGTVFTKEDPRPAERALAEGLEFKLRSLSSSKRNINHAVNLLQTAESGLSEINNMLVRMKEISSQAASTTINNRERRYLFVEYEALRDEVNRIATTTEFNGLPLLNGEDPDAPEEMVFRLGSPHRPESGDFDTDDVNAVRFEGFRKIRATSEGLGIRSAQELLEQTYDGVSVEDVEYLVEPDDEDRYSTIFDQALDRISEQRAVLGGMQARLQRAVDHVDVYQENIAAAKSSIADTDFAKQTSKMVESRILMHAGTSLMAQGNINARMALNLLDSVG